MRRIFLIFIFMSLTCGNSGKIGLEKKWETERVLKVPESVTYDQQRNILYVSNINGKPLDMDGNGFISKVRLDGSIESLEWVKNLNAPKGSALFGNTLYVTDIDRVVVINVETGEIIAEHPDPQAIFLNDVVVDQEGKVYISDYSGKNSIIYQLNQDKLEIWVRGSEIDKPNGLYISGNELLVGNSGDGKIKAIHLEKKTIRTVSIVGSGIDGLKMDGEGNFIVSDWAGKTSWITKEGQLIELINTTQQKINAADLEFIIEKNLIIIPTFFDNRLVAYELLRTSP